MAGQVRFWLRAGIASLIVGGVGAAAVAVASERVAPLTDSPTATVLAENAPLAEAFRDAFVGDRGVYDPEGGLVSPDEVAFDIEVQAAHNGEEIFFRYDVPTPLASYYHDYLVFQDGEWVRGGRSPVGPEPHGLYEDRITMYVDDGSVKGFANQGGWLTCHEDLRDPFMFASVPNEEVEAHPVLGLDGAYGNEDQRKYIPQSRDAGPEWWQFDGWGAMSVANLDVYTQRHEAGVFLDLWHWRAHRSEPIGYSDNQFVFEHRNSSPGKGPYTTNWDDDDGQPAFMFDPTVAGRNALDWDTVQDQGYGWEDQFFLAEDVNALAFDPDHDWQNGDTIPRRLLRIPDESRGAIASQAELVADGDAWRWKVELRRALDTGYPLADKAFTSGRTYDAAVAVHRLATGSRWHFVTLPFSVGIDMPADVTAARFDGDRPDWAAIEPTTLTAIYPGQTNWEWITSDDHPGAQEIRADSMSVLGCHDDPVGLAAANRSIEPQLAGLSVPTSDEAGLLARVFDPGNAAFVFFIIAIGTILGAVLLARRRSPATEEEQP
jgi:hypothetical protein